MLKSYTQKLIQKLLLKESNYSDHFFCLVVCLSFCFACVVTIGNLLIGIPKEVSFWSGGVALIFLIVLFLYKQNNKKFQFLGRMLFFLSSIAALNALWIFNGGSMSPTPATFVVFMVLIVYLDPKPGASVISVLIGINIVILLLIEWKYPQLIQPYFSDKQRILDHIIAMAFLFTTAIPALAYARKVIVKEKEQAERDNKQKSAYLANMSHEIRTPMNAIVGFAELLQHPDIEKEEQQEYISIIKQNSDLLLNMINNILDLSKLEANLINIKPAKFCLNSLLTQVYNAHINQARKRGIYLEKDLPDDLRTAVIEIDRTLLFEVFSNLITNALKVTSEGDVRFGVRRKKEKLSFFVFDTGPGIPKEQQKKIFERFSQLDNGHSSRNSTGGVGLGLSICKAIVKLLGGELTLYSEENKGSTFLFSFSQEILKFHSNQCFREEDIELFSEPETSFRQN
jgi:signal transduction histidine kinase